jgi:monoamine oxidase
MTMRSDGKGGGQYLRIREGTSAFAEGLVKKLHAGSVKLSSPVAEVHQLSDGTVSISTKGPAAQIYLARKVIVSVPTPVYKTIHFSPPLPASKSAVVNRTRYGFYTKYIVSFSEAFWTEKKLCGLAQSFVGPVSVFRDTSLGHDQPAMTCFIGGSFGRKWAAQDAEGKKASVLQQISDIFADGQDISGLVVDVVESPWMEEEFSGWGCPCANLPPGVLADGWGALCAPFGNIFFAGTELSAVWRGYMEGAVRSGESGALEAIADLKAGHQRTSKL